MELERAARERLSLELKCEELGGRLDQYKRTVSVMEQEKAEALQSCHSLSQQVDRLEAELKGQQDSYTCTQQDLHALHQVSQSGHCILWMERKKSLSSRRYVIHNHLFAAFFVSVFILLERF